MAGDKRELILDLLARDKSGPGTKSFGKNIKDVGDAADKADGKLGKFSESAVIAGKEADDLGDESEQAARRLAKLDREIALTSAELKVMARQFADTSDAAERLDISKAIRKGENDVRRLTKSKSLLTLPEPNPADVSKWSSKLSTMLGEGITKAGPLAIGAGVTAAILAPTLGAAVAGAVTGGVGLGGLIGGIALVAKDPAISGYAKRIGHTFMEELNVAAKASFLEPVKAQMGKLEALASRSSIKIGQIFTNTAPFLGKFTDSIIGAGDAILDSLVYASGKAGPALDALGGLIQNVGEHVGGFIDTLADHSEDGAEAITELSDALGNIIDITGGVVGALGSIHGAMSKLDDEIDKGRYWLEDNSGKIDLTADGYKKGSEAAELYRQKIIGAKGATNDYDHYLQAAADSTNKLADSQTNAEQAADGHREALAALSKELQAETDPVFGLLDAEDKLAAAQKDVTEATKQHGKGSREADAALRKLAEAALDLEGKAGALSSTFDGNMTPALRATLRTAGLTESEIDRLGRQFVAARKDGDSFAKTYKANVKVDGTETASARVAHVRDLLKQVRSKRISVSVLVADSQLDKVANTLNRFGGARAGGGPTAKDVPYWVGENGPELFVPGGNGRVLSAAQSKNAAKGHATSGLSFGGGGVPQRLQLELVGQAELVTMFRYLIRTANLLQDA